MTTYLVTIRYEGAKHYFVEAADAEAAEELAKERYRGGDDGDQTGAEGEEITQVITEKFDE